MNAVNAAKAPGLQFANHPDQEGKVDARPGGMGALMGGGRGSPRFGPRSSSRRSSAGAINFNSRNRRSVSLLSRSGYYFGDQFWNRRSGILPEIRCFQEPKG